MDFQRLFYINREFENRTFDWDRLIFFLFVRLKFSSIGFDLLCRFLCAKRPQRRRARRNGCFRRLPDCKPANRFPGVISPVHSLVEQSAFRLECLHFTFSYYLRNLFAHGLLLEVMHLEKHNTGHVAEVIPSIFCLCCVIATRN